MYVAREASKLWRKITTEFSVEWPLLMDKWNFILFGLVFQYLHGLAARAVHYLHRPGPVLQDIGFAILPELGQDKAYISEMLFISIFCSFVLWTFYPFVFHVKRFYTVLMWHRCLTILVISQCLRIASFMVTQLPGPNYHCREGSMMASLPTPKSISEVILINFPYGIIYGCGDLIFSSHMIFTLVFVRTYQKYGSKRWIKQLAWVAAIVLSVLIVASRKHYTVDIVVAWYTVNLVVFYVDRQIFDNEVTERTSSGGSPLLPSTMRDKDGQGKEEHHKLINGNGAGIGDMPPDWRQRTPINGKIIDDGSPNFGSPTLTDIVLNVPQVVHDAFVMKTLNSAHNKNAALTFLSMADCSFAFLHLGIVVLTSDMSSESSILYFMPGSGYVKIEVLMFRGVLFIHSLLIGALPAR